MPTLYSKDHLHIGAEWVGGELVISGHDLAPPEFMGDEYEYWVTVPADQLAALAEALGVGTGTPAMELGAEPSRDRIMAALVEQGGVICTRGESSWLKEHGVQTRFASYH